MIATPAPAAQGVCDLLVRAGVRSILNFAPVVLQVPDEVEVRKVDLAVELQILAFHVARRHLAAAEGGGLARAASTGTRCPDWVGWPMSELASESVSQRVRPARELASAPSTRCPAKSTERSEGER